MMLVFPLSLSFFLLLSRTEKKTEENKKGDAQMRLVKGQKKEKVEEE